MFKEDESFPSTASNVVTTTTDTPSSDNSGDEEAISSSSKLYEERPQSQSPPLSMMRQKTGVDSPPDDMGAFFGHPLTRASNALNGEEADSNADAEALLHEYKHLASINKEEMKVGEKHAGYLDNFSGQDSSPLLTMNHPEISSSFSSEHPPSPTDPGIIPQSGADNYKVEAVEAVNDCCQQADDMSMTSYGSIFHLEDYIMDAGTSEVADSVQEVSENTKAPQVKRPKSTRKVTGSASQKRQVTGEVKRAIRKSRSRSDTVTSTTNNLSGNIDNQTVSRDHAGVTFQQPGNVGVISVPCHQFEPNGAVVASTDVTSELLDVHSASSVVSKCAELFTGTASSSLSGIQSSSSFSTDSKPQGNNPNSLPLSSIKDQAALNIVSNSNSSSKGVLSCSSTTQMITASSTTPSSVSTANTVTSSVKGNTQTYIISSSPYDSVTNENNYLKRALSEKIRCRLATEESLTTMPSNSFHVTPEDVSSLAMEVKFSPMSAIKQESYIEYFDQHYSYGSELGNTATSLTNSSAASMVTSVNSFQNLAPITMTMCEEAITPSDDITNNGLSGLAPSSFHHISNNSTDHSSYHHTHQHHHLQQQQCHFNHNQVSEDTMVVQSSHGQYFQVLQPLRPLLEPHPQGSHPIRGGPNILNNTTTGYYNNMHHNSPTIQHLDSNKQIAPERYLQNPYSYSNDYSHFLTPENNYCMKSPDSGFQEPCVSPLSSSMVMKDVSSNGAADGVKGKTKGRKSFGGGFGGGLVRQFSSSGLEKASPKLPAIQKLEVNSTGYSYYLETPISTTQRKTEDRVTYLNKSQYYGLSLEFNTQERLIKCAVVKSVIILAFREEKSMEEERKAWEFWHGRQHSYKQRILDIDTKNCQGVLPQNIEELSFNAVAVKWNPMEGPVRVNIAVHCLSTDFSNQKGVKGIPLHIQIDTYEQSPKETHLVHRGYCQIKAFCDKGAERKTRDEERRKAAKGKSHEFAQVSVSNKSRKKVDEVFHESCDRSEFYSMANITLPPVFFNPLYENTEFIHKSLTIGVVPSQDEEISSLPAKLDLPDSCDDFYSNSPAKRPRTDSVSNLKDFQKVLLYIRERHETAFTALMLEAPTLDGLLRSIELKYSIAPSKVKNFYKKSRKGILVKLDDNIVRHYSHEATFIIEKHSLNESGDYEIILVEIDPVSL